MLLEFWWAWDSDHFPGKPVPVTNHSLSEEYFPNVQSEMPLTWLHVPLPFLHILLVLSRADQHLPCALAPLEEVVGCDEGAPQPWLLRAEETKRPQPLVWLSLEIFHHLGHPPLGTLFDSLSFLH